jgi:four helix bundle protein
MEEPKFTQKDIWQRSFKLGIRIIRLTRDLPNDSVAWVLIKQIVRSATSIAANIAEGTASSSKKEFIRYQDIARKSATETYNWLLFIEETFDLYSRMQPIKQECHEIIKIITTIVLNSKEAE